MLLICSDPFVLSLLPHPMLLSGSDIPGPQVPVPKAGSHYHHPKTVPGSQSAAALKFKFIVNIFPIFLRGCLGLGATSCELQHTWTQGQPLHGARAEPWAKSHRLTCSSSVLGTCVEVDYLEQFGASVSLHPMGGAPERHSPMDAVSCQDRDPTLHCPRSSRSRACGSSHCSSSLTHCLRRALCALHPLIPRPGQLPTISLSVHLSVLCCSAGTCRHL